MIRNPRERSRPAKEEEEEAQPPAGDGGSRAWPAALRDTRVVRGSRANGGKDRHSKVTTARGLRDRRVRLSVQTAIQLYDLQDRLGLNQPSKAVDWLLHAAQHEIDKLPPLQFPPGSSLFYQAPPPPPQEDLQNPFSAFYFMESSLQNAGGGGVAPQSSFYRPEGLPSAAALPLPLPHGSQLLLSMFSPCPADAASSEYDPRNIAGGFQAGSSSQGEPKPRHF